MQAGTDPTTSALLGRVECDGVKPRGQVVWSGVGEDRSVVRWYAGQLNGADYGTGTAFETTDAGVCDEREPERAAVDPGAIPDYGEHATCRDAR